MVAAIRVAGEYAAFVPADLGQGAAAANTRADEATFEAVFGLSVKSAFIRTSALTPGLGRTSGTSERTAHQQRWAQATPTRRLGTLGDIAAAVVIFLASDEASFVQGAVFAVNGDPATAV